MKKAAIYLRISTNEKRQNFSTQEKPLREMCAARGLEIYNVYKDTASGAKDKRPGLDKLKQDASRGKFNIVLVWRFDRFARSTRHLIDSLATFEAQGIDFCSHSESIDTSTPAGKMVFGIMASLAEFERNLIIERIKAGLARSTKKSGRPMKITDRLKIKVQELKKAGLSFQAIGEKLSISKTTAFNCCNQN